jgi:hypothetical protein
MRDRTIPDFASLHPGYTPEVRNGVRSVPVVMAGLVPATPIMSDFASSFGRRRRCRMIGVAGTGPAMTVIVLAFNVSSHLPTR